MLGELQKVGQGGATKDPVAAFESWSRACDLRNATGCGEVAFAYNTGAPPVARDVTTARRFAEKGCALDEPQACVLFGQLTEDAGPPATAWPAAVDAYRRACNHDYQLGCSSLGRMMAFGRGIVADVPGAMKLLEPACDAHREHSCSVLADALHDFAPSDPRAALVATASCDRGYALSCVIGASIDPGHSDDFQRKACDLHNGTGCLAIAWALVGRKDFASARPFFEKACSTGDDDACESLSSLILGGRAYPRNEEEALGFAKIGCDAGGKRSCETIESFSRFVDVRLPFTKTVAGFAFGISVGDARRRCLRAGGLWFPVDENFACTAQPVDTFPQGMAIDLRFCHAKLCEVSAIGTKNPSIIPGVLDRLVTKYGAAGIQEGAVSPADLRAECLNDESRQLRRVWYFRPPNKPLNGRLVFTATCADAQFSVIYQDSVGVERRMHELDEKDANF